MAIRKRQIARRVQKGTKIESRFNPATARYEDVEIPNIIETFETVFETVADSDVSCSPSSESTGSNYSSSDCTPSDSGSSSYPSCE